MGLKSDWFCGGVGAFGIKTVGEVGGYYREVANENTNSEKAAAWFINHYSLLGGFAAGFQVIENQTYCWRNEIKVATVDITKAEIYVNPAANLDFEELKFRFENKRGLIPASLIKEIRALATPKNICKTEPPSRNYAGYTVMFLPKFQSTAAHSAAQDVPGARVIFCDARAYDAGYLSPEDIAGKIEVRKCAAIQNCNQQ